MSDHALMVRDDSRLTIKECRVDGCHRKARALGLCNAHWLRQHRNGHLDLSREVGWKRSKKSCTVPGCGRQYHANGYCKLHNERVARFGEPLAAREPKPQRGALANRWGGGTTIHCDGRILVYQPNHPHPSVAGKYVLRSRLVMEGAIGRFLSPEEVVHHRNEIVTDDRVDNLQLFPNQKAHAAFHNAKRQRLPNGTYA